MRGLRRRGGSLVLTIAMLVGGSATPGGQQRLDPAVERKIDGILARLTLDEKIGQMTQHARPGDPTGPAGVRGHAELREMIRAGRIGSLLNFKDPAEIAELQKLALASHAGIPIIFGLDVIHGYRTVFPVPIGEASSWDPGLATANAKVAAREAARQGIHWTFAPMMDIARDPRWGRIMEGAGEDPFLGSAFAAARVQGFQDGGLIACAKHYVGYGAADGGRDYNGADLPESLLRDIYLPPFRSAVVQGADTVMSAFQSLNGVPSTANRHTLTDILRGEWRFTGFVVSDWGSIAELIRHGVAADGAEAARLAVNAGVDMDMEGRIYEQHLAGLVKRGVVAIATIDESVRRILRVKIWRGLFPDSRAAGSGADTTRVATPPGGIDRAQARHAAHASMVLLKNDKDLLPLAPTIKRIALVGPLADAAIEQMGEWAADGRAADVVTVAEAFRQRATSAGLEVRVAKGADINTERTDGFADAVAAAKASDVVVAVLGESARMSGEAASRASLSLPGVQEALLRAVVESGTPVVLVLMNGRPLVIPWAAGYVPAILEAWLPGTEGGPAIVDLLFGDESPSGKLPVSLARSVGQIPLYYNHRPTGRPATTERYTSKYLDESNDALFPFGFGLSYTQFAYQDLKVSPATATVGGTIDVQVLVANTGRRAGAEVVQLYVRDEVASRSRPVRELKGFRKVTLGPGQSEVVHLALSTRDLGFHNDAGKFIVEPGRFRVFVGGSSLADLESGFEVNVKAPARTPASRAR